MGKKVTGVQLGTRFIVGAKRVYKKRKKKR